MMTSTTSSPSVFDRNTQAVVSLRAGRVEEAMRGLRETLVQARSMLSQDGGIDLPQVPPMAANEWQSQNGPPLSLFTVALASETPYAADKYLPLASDIGSSLCPLFHKAFVVVTEDEDRLVRTQSCQNITLSAVLYNLGLTHHLVGITQGKPNELQVALNLYSMALSLLETSVNAGSGEQRECHNVVLLLLAVFNNMANIHAHNFDKRQTRSCMEVLKGIINSYTDNTLAASAQDAEDHFFFYLNIFVTAPSVDFALAPAA